MSNVIGTAPDQVPVNGMLGDMAFQNKVAITIGTLTSGTLTSTGDATISGMTVGKGLGAVATNTAIGVSALAANTSGQYNAAFGYQALTKNTTANYNSAFGLQALLGNTTASNNVAVGYNALTLNTTGVATLGTITAGTGYTNGTYNGVAMSAVSGATFTVYPTVNITVAGGVVTVCTLVTAGTRATVNTATVLTVAAALIGGTGSGFTIPVATFAQGANNSAFGTSAGSAITTGANNVVIGSYTGATAPISATGSSYIVLSDGIGIVRQTYNASGSLAFDTAGTSFGTSGQVLQSNGSAAVPTWVTPAGGAGVGETFNPFLLMGA